MDLIQLDCLVTVARLGTVTAAASSMRISQPAITKRLQALESELGTTLFVRRGRNLSLSYSGRQLLPRAEEILNACSEFKYAAAATQGLRAVRLSVRAASGFLPNLLLHLKEKYPGVDFQVVQEQDKNADLTIDAALEENCSQGTRLLLKEQVVVAVPDQHPLASRKEVSLTELCRYSLVSLCLGRSMREIEDALCAQSGVTLHRSVECDAPSTLRSLISRGGGIALTASRSWAAEPSDQVRLIPLSPRRWRYVSLCPAIQLLNDAFILALCSDIQAFFQALDPEYAEKEAKLLRS